MSTALVWVIIIGAVLAIYVAKYVIRLIVYKGADAVSDAIKDKKRQETPKPENLADKYEGDKKDNRCGK